MDKKKIDFSYKVRGDFSPNGLQKVFFSYHPDDMELLDIAAKEILSVADCAIFYHSEKLSLQEIDADDLGLKIKEMKMMVVLITTNFLRKDSLAKSWEYGFAMENHIPVLPIAMESDLEAYFEREMNRVCEGYGNMQLLRYHTADSSEISYREKLIRDLKSILVEDTDVERIRKAFQAQIFLSYRKKDRKYANELMRTIHDIPSLRNVAVWYDEFLSTGEAWDDQIWNALKASDAFLLMVTPSITEPDNYVIKEEYPAARKQDLPIVTVRKGAEKKKAPDLQTLGKLFPGLTSLIDGDDTCALEQALIKLVNDDGTTPEKDYLIGLAFLNGVDVEKNSERAVTLIIAAAQKGLPEAVNKLADMYWNGDGVAVNFESSIHWRKNLVALYEGDGQKLLYADDIPHYVDAVERLCMDLYELSDYRSALFYSKKLEEYSSSVYGLTGKIYLRLGQYDKAEECCLKHCRHLQEIYDSDKSLANFHNLSVGFERVGNVKYAVRDFAQAEEWYMKALEIGREIDEKLGSIDSAFSLSCTLLMLGDIRIRNNEFGKADKMYEKAAAIRKRILDAEETHFSRKGYAEAILSRGTSRLLMNDAENAKALFDEAMSIFADLADQYGTIESQRDYSVALNRQGAIALDNDMYYEALEYYEESLNCRKAILSHVRINEYVFDCALTLFYIGNCYKGLLETDPAKKSYDEAIRMLLPILPRDKKSDWHWVFAEAAFERFKLDTFAGKHYLEYAITAWDWLTEKEPGNLRYRKKLEMCQKVYQRCYPRQ